MTILYADDDREEIGFFCQAVKTVDSSITCITAESGEQVLILLKTINVPALIFLDLNMPRVSGKECLIELKRSSRLKNTPVVIYSNMASKKDIQELYDLGAYKFLTKKCSIAEMCDEIRDIIKRHRSEGD